MNKGLVDWRTDWFDGSIYRSVGSLSKSGPTKPEMSKLAHCTTFSPNPNSSSITNP